jgi:hypothetical protein
MAQSVSRWPLTAEDGLTPGSIHVEFMVDKMALEQAFVRVLWFCCVSALSFHRSSRLDMNNICSSAKMIIGSDFVISCS